MSLRDYEEVARPEFLALPIKGKTYHVPPVGAVDGIKLKLAVEKGADKPEAALPDEEFYRIMLSEKVLTRMRADNVPEKAITRAALTAYTDHTYGRVEAEAFWETGNLPELLAAYMAASRDSQPSKSSASARKTRSPASTRRTTSPKTTPRTRRTAAAGAVTSGGPKSSSNGA